MTGTSIGGTSPGGTGPGGADASDRGRRDGDDRRTFEELMAELEELTGRLATGDLGIEAAVELYERAEKLHGLATARLEQVRQRVDRLGPAGSGPSA